MSDLQITIEKLQSDRVLEAASMFFADRLGIEDPQEAASKIVGILGRPNAQAGSLITAAETAASDSTGEVVSLLRLALVDAATVEGSRDQVRQIVEAAGQRQMVVTPDLILLCVMLLTGYLAVRSGGASERTVEVVEEADANGRIKVTTRTTEKYIDPFSALGKLLKGWLLPLSS